MKYRKRLAIFLILIAIQFLGLLQTPFRDLVFFLFIHPWVISSSIENIICYQFFNQPIAGTAYSNCYFGYATPASNYIFMTIYLLFDVLIVFMDKVILKVKTLSYRLQSKGLDKQ